MIYHPKSVPKRVDSWSASVARDGNVSEVEIYTIIYLCRWMQVRNRSGTQPTCVATVVRMKDSVVRSCQSFWCSLADRQDENLVSLFLTQKLEALILGYDLTEFVATKFTII